MKELKSCPLCDGQATILQQPTVVPRYGIGCTKCQLSTRAITSKKELIEYWNARTSDAQIESLTAQLNAAREALIYINNRIFDLETGRVDLRNNEYLTDSRRIIKATLNQQG